MRSLCSSRRRRWIQAADESRATASFGQPALSSPDSDALMRSPW
jgi:hypothetical protein